MKQMELFQEGGLKDEGGTKDPVSGNDVPPGATQEEVRDDIPAQLSEGEFVFPADVVRYIGLEKLMRMRQEAKMGLKMMEEMGQMGNADEATIPDDIPFSVIDIQIAEGDDDDDEVEKRAEGGVIEAANGFAGTTTATNPLQTRQSSMTASPTGLKTAYTAPIIPTATVAPTGGFQYKSPIEAKQRATFKCLFGGDELTQGPDEYRTYVNDSGAEIQIPFKNGKILTGFSVPQGFKPQTDDPRDTKIQTAKTKTARVEQETGGDDGGDSETGDLGGARTTIGGVEYAVQYNLDGTVGLQSINNYRSTGRTNFQKTTPEIAEAIKQQTYGQIAQLAYGPRAKLAVELSRKAGLEIPGAKKVEGLIKGAKVATTKLSRIDPTEVSVFDTDQFLTKDQTKAAEALGKGRRGKDLFSRPALDKFSDTYDEKLVTGKGAEGLKEKDMRSIQAGLQSKTGLLDTSGIDLSNLDPSGDLGGAQGIGSSTGAGSTSFGGSDDGGFDTSPDDFSSDTGFGSDISTAVGGFIPKKKPKPKKMKRGGLASK